VSWRWGVSHWVTLVEPYPILPGVHIPSVACCYLFVIDQRHVYVGSTQDLLCRMRQHFRSFRGGHDGLQTPWGVCSSFVLKFKPSRRYGDWLMDEARLIKKLRPALNIRGVNSQPVRSKHKKSTDGFPLLDRGVYASVDEFLYRCAEVNQ
jgi:hypothetical protein